MFATNVYLGEGGVTGENRIKDLIAAMPVCLEADAAASAAKKVTLALALALALTPTLTLTRPSARPPRRRRPSSLAPTRCARSSCRWTYYLLLTTDSYYLLLTLAAPASLRPLLLTTYLLTYLLTTYYLLTYYLLHTTYYLPLARAGGRALRRGAARDGRHARDGWQLREARPRLH